MERTRLGVALRGVQALFEAGTAGNLTDGQLLGEFVGRDGPERERAFEALVERHGPAVLRTCRAILGDEHDAADAFQAAFLVLARRAGSLRVNGSLAPWLHEVAGRVARCARASSARRRRHERRASELLAATSASSRETGIGDLGPILHEEIDRLPPRYRAPVVLCLVEGLTREQAAGRLRWPVGTVQSRLARGRERLRDRLVRRGLAPSAVGILCVSNVEAGAVIVPASLLDATVRAALAMAMKSAAGRSAIAGPAALSGEVLRTMFHHELRMIGGGMIAGVLLAAGVVGAGAAWALQANGPGPNPAPAGSQPEAPAPAVAPPVPAVVRTLPDPAVQPASPPAAADSTDVLKHHDGKAEAKQSIGGSGEMIHFSAEQAPVRATGVRIHGSRYGMPQAPDEDFLIYFLDEDRKHVLHTELAPYSLFERGQERWVSHRFERPVELPKSFWVVLDFRAGQRKGVYVSYDTSTGGRHSLVGLPGTLAAKSRLGGDWVVEVMVRK